MNDTQVVTAQDTTYSMVFSTIGTGPMVPNVQPGPSDVRWGNLVVTGTPPSSGTVVLSDSFKDPSASLLPASFNSRAHAAVSLLPRLR